MGYDNYHDTSLHNKNLFISGYFVWLLFFLAIKLKYLVRSLLKHILNISHEDNLTDSAIF